MTNDGLDPDSLRTRFVAALSEMYIGEVPLYGKLVDIVRQVDKSILDKKDKTSASLPVRHELERHGAIRLGTEQELNTIRRLFRVFGMYPVGYYDLGVAKLPLHATAFRPITEDSLRKNPFRVFTSLLRRDRLSPKTRRMAEHILEKRNLFTPRLLEIIERKEAGQDLKPQDAEDLITDALEIFRWHSKSVVSMDQYLELKREHPMVADIVCFPSAHINHLTPRTLGINLVQEEMIRQGLPAKESIEGPPVRQCPILLRQTSFKALEERVSFADTSETPAHGTHTARFGEIEQRGAAVTRKGRELYDRLLDTTRKEFDAMATPGTEGFDEKLAENFSKHFPDSWEELRVQDLVYFRYRVTPAGKAESNVPRGRAHISHVADLLAHGIVEYEPITYEDFLPFSAAGIFQSNLSSGSAEPRILKNDEEIFMNGSQSSSRSLIEEALGCEVSDEFCLYENLQHESLQQCARALNLASITVG